MFFNIVFILSYSWILFQPCLSDWVPLPLWILPRWNGDLFNIKININIYINIRININININTSLNITTMKRSSLILICINSNHSLNWHNFPHQQYVSLQLRNSSSSSSSSSPVTSLNITKMKRSSVIFFCINSNHLLNWFNFPDQQYFSLQLSNSTIYNSNRFYFLCHIKKWQRYVQSCSLFILFYFIFLLLRWLT